MKNKSSRHKEDNTFKFQPFAERIANIDVDIFHKVEHEYETQTEDESYFHQAIQKWNVLNLTESYEAFRREVRADNYVTLPQLLLSKDCVVEILIKHLKLKNPLSLQPLLEIVVAVARDLRKDFYDYYPQFLELLIDLLNTKDTEQLEWSFTCLAYLFKFLWRPLIKNISSVFNALLPLLSDSKPEYINKFAAESFAFVARKVKDRKAFLVLLLKAVKSRQDGVVGCGKLLFEVLRGVDGQFHSAAESLLPFFLESLSDEKLPQGVLFEILEQIIGNIVLNIQPVKCDLLWRSFQAIIDSLLESWKAGHAPQLSNNLELILKLLGQSVEYRSGRLLQNPVPVIQQLIKLLSVGDLPEHVLLTICKIGILLLLSKNIKLPQEQASSLIRKILFVPQKTVFLYFVDNIYDYTSFEPLILPSLLKHVLHNDLDADSLHVLTKLVMRKAPLHINGIKLHDWVKYPLDFGAGNERIKSIFKASLKIHDKDILEDFDQYFCGLVCLPHLNLTETKDLIEDLEGNLRYFIEVLQLNRGDSLQLKKLLFLLNNTVECLIHLGGSAVLLKHYSEIAQGMLGLANDPNYIASLNVLSLLLTFLKEDAGIISMENLTKINDFLEENFSSPHHEVRLLTTHIYTVFEGLPEFKLKHSQDPEVPTENWKVFSICYRVESIEAHVHTYRDQLQSLEGLNFDKPQMIMCNQTIFKTIPLRFLCGALYINFQLLWEPITKIIESQAHGLDISTFWSVFGAELKKVTENISEPKEFSVEVISSKCDFLADFFQNCQKLIVKPDFVNYRLLLWKAMVLFPDVAEAKTKDTAELFLTFISNGYNKSNSELGIVCNIKEHSEEPLQEDMDDEDNDEEEKDIQRIKKELLKPLPKSNGRANLKTLLQMLGVFSKIRSPLSMYREPELYKLYFDLLQHKNSQVQKGALDCIMTYKHKFLTPYRDNLYNLVDEKNFKKEITAFRVDKDSEVVLPEHRPNMIPIVMQIVFSKMSVKTGLRTGGKSSGQNRRNLVLRFLAGCQEDEMLKFIEKSFRIYQNLLDDNPEIMVETISKSVNLEKFIPPKRLQSSINLLNVVLEQFGGLMGDNLLAYLLKILLAVGAVLMGALNQVANIHAGYLSILRNLRTSCIKIVGRFFEHFDRYLWNNNQINAIFTVFVWPYLDKLNVEGIHSPTTLLKLFLQWGSNPRYFPLLVKHQIDNSNQYILPHVVKLLVNERSHGSVVNAIQEMIEKLLSLQPDEEDLKMAIPIDNLLPVQQDILHRAGLNNKLNYGSCILLPHVPVVLEKIKRRLEGKSKNLNQREIFILSRISELVWEPEVSDKILNLLLPVVHKKCCGGAAEELVLQFLTTIKNLLQNVPEPMNHLKQVSPLFAEVSYPSGRKILALILENMARKNESLKIAADLITELNAWDAKWLDQPDFERRHNAFGKIQEVLTTDCFDLHCGILLVYNCYFLIKSEKDLSLRENSSHSLRTICPILINKYKNSHKDIDYILNGTVFTLIRSGMKSKRDDFRNECILLLGHLARECPDSHFIFRDLNKLTNKVDMEVDFFANLTHLQLHRHARALLKFCQITKEQTTAPNPRTLTQFILPLASFYLCSEKYASKNSVVDAAIETIGCVCRILPWHQYEVILKFYLGRLRYKIEYQKQLVRLTVTILDAFHFDLSKGHEIEAVKVVTSPADVTEPKKIVEEKENVGEEVVEAEIEVDEALELEGDQGVDDEEEIEEAAGEMKAYLKINVLCKSTAIRVIKTIQNVLLPQLHKSLAEMTRHDSSHKINRKRTGSEREEEDLLRVPISLALVKLLQRLPKEILEVNLPGIFMKLCTFLRSQLDSVRRVARETFQKIMLTLGPTYLGLLLSQISPLLSRGFQVHVLVFTTHAILNCLKEMYQPTDIDKVLSIVLNLCKADLFGALSEEREVAKIVVKVSEAKSTKSFDTFQILAQHITEKCFLDLIMPIKQVLESSHSFKTVHKAQECLRHIAMGLVDNSFISVESLLKFAYGTASQSIPQLVPKEKKKLTDKEREKLQREKPDCFIIPKMPVNRTSYRQSNVKSSTATNAHMLVEFGVRLAHIMLKKEKIRDEEYKPFVDPFVVIFKKCLNSKHVKLSTLTLQCLSWVMKYDLPSMHKHITSIVKDMFNILHKYASAGLSKGDNFNLVVAAFKAMSVLVRDVKYYTINVNQLKILLLYAEQDMHDYNRQATAFGLMKAIIARKLVVPEIHDIMQKVAELSIISELNHVRLQARIVFHQFLMEYPLGHTLEKHLGFYLSQMSYEMQYGRESALEMAQTLISSFPMKVLASHSATFLVTLGARLVNDDVPECRKMAGDCLFSMLSKLPKLDRDPLFEIVVLWLKDKNISHRRLAAQICGVFVMVEKSDFYARIPALMPLILKQFGLDNTPGKFVKVAKEKDSKTTDEHERVKDHHLFQMLQLLLKISAQCPAFFMDKGSIENLANHAQTLLGYPHEWVRLGAAQFLGFVLLTTDFEHLATLLTTDQEEQAGYLYNNPEHAVKSLTLDLCDQLQPGSVTSDMAEQVIKNLVFVARVLQKVPADQEKKINLLWLAKRMRKIVNTEIVEDASSTVLRTEVFKWIAGVGTALELDKIVPVLPHLLAPLVREMITTEEKNAPLRQLAKQVANLFKKLVGIEDYTRMLSKLQQNLSGKRAERKRVRTQLAVTNPEIYAKKKIKRHEKKKETKKRKISELKGVKRNFKKRKVVDLDSSEVM